jgi:plasmid maintenance system antidote protein VapI
MPTPVTQDSLRELFSSRGLTSSDGAVLVRVDKSTMSRIINGRTRAQPWTVLALAKALGVGVTRMQAMCSAAYEGRQRDEAKRCLPA